MEQDFSEEFTKNIETIDRLINRRRHKWTLKCINWISWEDVVQIIRIHIFRKWHLYDPTKAIEPWISRIVSNQMINLARNFYYVNARPCVQRGGCAFNEGGEACGYTKSGLQCGECPLYAKWERKKKDAFNIRLPLPTENHINEISEIPEENFDLEKSIKNFHIKMEGELKPHEYRIYKCLYIEHMTEEETAKKLGFTSNEPNRKAGYGRIRQVQRIIMVKANKVKKEIDLS